VLAPTKSPSGPSAILTPASLNLTTDRTLSASLSFNTTVAGTYTVTVTASSGSLSHTVTITVTVVDFSIASTTSVEVNHGSAVTTSIVLTSLNGFANTVLLTNSTSPLPGILVNLSTRSITLTPGGSGLSILTVFGSTVGNYTITITGTNGALHHTISIRITVVEFSIVSGAVSPTSINVGSMGNSNITVTGVNGFSRNVALSVSSSSPLGLSCSVTPTSLVLPPSPSTSLLTCTASVARDYTVTVTGINGTLSHTTSIITFHFVDFTLAPSKASVTLIAGSGTTGDSLTLTSLNSFTGIVTMSVSISPSGPSVQFLDPTVKLPPGGNSTSLTINAGPFAGIFKLNVTGTNGSLIRSTLITLTVTPANPTITTVIKDSNGATATSVTAGTTVHDTATINGGTQSGGTVTYTFFTNGLCTAPGTSASTVSVTNGVVPDSSAFTPVTPGSYSFNATYSGDANNNKASSSCESLNVTSKLTPTLGTTIKDTNGVTVTTVLVGTAVHDTATLSGGSPVITGTITYFFFSNLQCSGPPSTAFAPFPQTVTIGSGNSIPASATLIPGAGPYSFNATYSGDAINNPVTSSCEPLTINKQTPVITTAISPSSTITVGASVTDQATLTGGYPSTGVTGSVTYAFFGSGSCFGTPISSSIVTVSAGNFVPASSAIAPPSAGSFAFNATYSGDANNTRISSSCKPLTVTKQTPSMTTNILPSSTITVGASVTDQATLTGGFPSVGVTGSVVYAFFTNSLCVGSPASTSTVIVGAGNSVPISSSVTPSATGSFAFNATYGGDSNNNKVSASCEPLTVNKQTPAISTTISPASPIVVGPAVTDRATLTGGFPSTGITGTVSYFFFTGSTCTGTAVSEGTVTIGTGNSVPVSNSVTPSPAGLYSFNATYSGDSNNNRVSSACEPLTVQKAAPAITTAISPAFTITVGASVTDQATLTGGFPSTGVTGSVTYAFFSNSACNGSPTSSSTVTVGAADSVPPSNSVTPPSAGSFAFNATYSGDTNNSVAKSSCEPLTVNKATPSVTTSINPSSTIVVGTPVSDQVTITGGFPSSGVTGTVTYEFFGVGDGSCIGTPAASQIVTVGSTNSVPSSSPQTPSMAGQYSFNATYSGDTNNNQVTSSCESLTVNLVSTTTVIICGSSVTVDVPTSCTITVSDVAPGTLTPTGTVNLSTNSTGTFNPPSPCSLSGTTNSASCTVTYTPLVLGGHNVTATYGGDSKHAGSSGFSVLSPGKHTTSISISCSSPILANQASTCTATVTDTSTVGATTPIGSVAFSESGVPGSFNVTSCALVGTYRGDASRAIVTRRNAAAIRTRFFIVAPQELRPLPCYGGPRSQMPSKNVHR